MKKIPTPHHIIIILQQYIYCTTENTGQSLQQYLTPTSGLLPGVPRNGYFLTISNATLFRSSAVGCRLKDKIALAVPDTNFWYIVAESCPCLRAISTSIGYFGNGNGSGISLSSSSSTMHVGYTYMVEREKHVTNH